MDKLLPPCPDHMQGPISYQRMVDPVVAGDGFTYERSKIEEWLDKNNTSPMTQQIMVPLLIPNQAIKTQIQEWVEENTGLRGLQKQLKSLHGPLVTASSPKEALDAIVVIGKLVTRSKLVNICILSPNGVGKMRRLIDTEGNLSEEVTNALNTLEQQCVVNVCELQENYSKVLKELTNLQKAKMMVLGGGGRGNKLKKDVAAADKKKASAEKAVEKVESALVKAKGVLKNATEAHEKMKKPLERFNKQTSMFEKLEREMNQEEEKMEQQLVCVEKLVVVEEEEEDSSGSSSSSSSSSSYSDKDATPRGTCWICGDPFGDPLKNPEAKQPRKCRKNHTSTAVGSKRGRSSSSSSSSRRSKRQKNELAEEEEREEEEEKHPGLWLYEEGMAYWQGSDFKKKDEERGQMMIEASASSGCPLAVAHCHDHGWNGLKKDRKKGFEMYLKIEKETNGDHWAQFWLGYCYKHGEGTDQEHNKKIEFYTKSAEQGNGLAMNNLGSCYYNGEGCDKNFTKAFEWYEKSAKLGSSSGMYNVGDCYKDGEGVTKDLNKAKEWYAKAVAQGDEEAQEYLDALNQ